MKRYVITAVVEVDDTDPRTPAKIVKAIRDSLRGTMSPLSVELNGMKGKIGETDYSRWAKGDGDKGGN